MKQILHIFVKDVRRFWIEIAVLLALIAAGVGIYSYVETIDPMAKFGSSGAINVANNLKQTLILFVALVPIGWWLLISRVIHAERLVGDTQFWITRPYEWTKLLVAKLLFLAAFIYLPLLVAHGIILAETGFSPLAYTPGLLYNLLLYTGLFLPLTALVTVTLNFARLTLTLLGALLAITLASVIPPLVMRETYALELHARIEFILALVISIAVILLQYWLRKTRLSILLLIAFPLLICGINFIDLDSLLMNRNYPSTATTTLQVSFTQDRDHAPNIWTGMGGGHQMFLQLPIQASGIADGTGVISDSARIEIVAPDGSHWTSKWDSQFHWKIFASHREETPIVMIPKAVYEEYKSTPLTVHVTMALTQMKAGKVTQIALPAPNHEFAVPGFGLCAMPWDNHHLSCISAMPQPLVYVSAHTAATPCANPIPTRVPDREDRSRAWAGSIDPAPAELVFMLSGSFPTIWNEDEDKQLRTECAGLPITFTEYEKTGRTQTSFTINDFHLPAQGTN